MVYINVCVLSTQYALVTLQSMFSGGGWSAKLFQGQQAGGRLKFRVGYPQNALGSLTCVVTSGRSPIMTEMRWDRVRTVYEPYK